MMGSSHALSGAAVWLTGSLLLDQVAHFHQTPLQLAVGTAICAGGALLPDLDLSGRVTRNQGGATVARTFGVLSLFVAECVEKLSLGVYKLTRMKHDPPRQNGHRTLTHTIVFNVGVGYGTLALCNAYGKWAVMGVLFLSFALALRGLFEKWAERAGWIIVTLASAGAAYLVYERLPGDRGYPLLGLAVGVGGLVHLLGDMLTRHGSPIFWPIPTGRRMWRCVGLPQSIALTAGDKTEMVFLRIVFTTVAILSGTVLLVPMLLQRFNIAL
ncbi:metal-dependent hydrolase [Dactylosporangium sp. NPDC051484]|uniref:metal-dependent hydrolase n=1 Tax=Dactylosporangium sp. NPDC051484 TaxID=3154942 RepID=UPI0034505F5A